MTPKLKKQVDTSATLFQKVVKNLKTIIYFHNLHYEQSVYGPVSLQKTQLLLFKLHSIINLVLQFSSIIYVEKLT